MFGLSQKQGQRIVAAIAAFVVGLVVYLPIDQGLQVLTAALITALAGVIVYPDKEVPPDA